MALMQLAKSRWHEFFESASKALGAQTIKVEVTGLELGDQVAADWVPLIGITYEPREDSLTLSLEGLQHRIRHPQSIYVDQDVNAIRSMEVVDPDGVHHIAQFSAALELAAP